MNYSIIKKTIIGLFILFTFFIIVNLKEDLKVPTKCDFDECFTNLNLEEDYLGPGPGPKPPRSPISNPLPLSRLE
jgi:hypothetical protein